MCFLKSSADKFLTERRLKIIFNRVHEISCVYEPAAGLRIRKFSLFFLHLTTTKNFDLVLHSHVLVTLYVPFLSQIGQNLTGEFMWKIFEASGNLFIDC